MWFRKSEGERDPNADLVDELVRAVHDQIQKDGSARTPAHSADEKKRALTERWRGARIVAAVMDDGIASITKTGVMREHEDGEGNKWGEPAKFPNARGRIEAVSTSHGGYIQLTNGMDVCLHIRGEGGVPLPDQELGLELSLR
jgi:hypothetical protein